MGEKKVGNFCYDNNIVASLLHGHIHSAVALLWFECLCNRPRWIRQCNPETFPRSSVIPEVFLKMHLLFSVVSRRSPRNYFKAHLYLLPGVRAFIYIRPRSKSSGSVHCLLNRLSTADEMPCTKRRRNKNKTRRWPEEMKDEPLWRSNCAVGSISNLINTVPQPSQCSDPALICSMIRCGNAVKEITF